MDVIVQWCLFHVVYCVATSDKWIAYSPLIQSSSNFSDKEVVLAHIFCQESGKVFVHIAISGWLLVAVVSQLDLNLLAHPSPKMVPHDREVGLAVSHNFGLFRWPIERFSWERRVEVLSLLLIRGTVFLLMTWWLWQLSTLHLALEWHVEQEVPWQKDPENHWKPMTSVDMNNIGHPQDQFFHLKSVIFCTEQL